MKLVLLLGDALLPQLSLFYHLGLLAFQVLLNQLKSLFLVLTAR